MVDYEVEMFCQMMLLEALKQTAQQALSSGNKENFEQRRQQAPLEEWNFDERDKKRHSDEMDLDEANESMKMKKLRWPQLKR